MPKLNIDNIKSLTETIEFTLGGKEYKVKDLTGDVLERAQATLDAIKDTGNAPNLAEVLAQQLAEFTGVDAADFRDLDVRKLTYTTTWIASSIKKAQEDGEKKALGSR